MPRLLYKNRLCSRSEDLVDLSHWRECIPPTPASSSFMVEVNKVLGKWIGTQQTEKGAGDRGKKTKDKKATSLEYF